MKNIYKIGLLFIAGLLLSATNVSSQGIGLGFRFGLNSSKFSNWSKLQQDDLVGSGDLFSSKTGLQWGYVFNPMFSKYFGMEFELNYEQKGYKLETSETYQGKTTRYELAQTYNYITLPVTFKGGYKYKNFSAYGFFGPYVALGLSGKMKFYENDNLKREYDVIYGEGEIDDDDDTHVGGPVHNYKANRLDFGLTLGFQPGYRLGPGDLVLDIRYSWGLLDINNPTAGQISDYNEAASDNDKQPYYGLCNRTFGISVGYIFRLGEKK